MDRSDLRSFADRIRALTDASPPTSTAETRSWLLEPLLETLGWDVHHPDCRTDVTVAGTRLQYVLAVTSTPGMFVAVESYAESLESDRVDRLQTTMARTGVDRAIYTNGRELVLLAGVDGSDRFECPLHAIYEHDDALAHFSKRSVAQRFERQTRRHAARRLAVGRAELASTIAHELALVAGERYQPTFQRASASFVDSLVEELADATSPIVTGAEPSSRQSSGVTESAAASRFDEDEPESTADAPLFVADDRSVGELDGDPDSTGDTGNATPERSNTGDPDPERSNTGDPDPERPNTGDPNPEKSATEPTDETKLEEEPETGSSADAAHDESGRKSGEYVVRFFGDRGSIGAIGHSRPEEATAHAAEFLFERGLSGIQTPWGPDDGQTVLNDEPTRSDGSPMPSVRELSNGLFLDTTGDTDELAARVVSMAERAGLRAMLTGDWSAERA
ncbi:hypothetical protein [Natronobeatus ordinarius]|uniref:hypothetical protein n=1 Tax=Natronobeatus ordinarius TaxID=2963433 RepID=UPI0020CF291E|nr:hypothetical protein [Natronobeatus ordinarius]